MDALKFNQLLKRMKYDKTAVEAIYSEYYAKLKDHVRGKFGTRFDPVDVTQDIFLKLMTLEHRKFITNPIAWLYTITDNHVKDLYRRNKHTTEELIDDIADDFDIDNTLLSEDMKRVMSCLDEESRKILYMHYWQDIRLCDIANILNMSYVNVRVKASRAYKSLKEILKKNNIIL